MRICFPVLLLPRTVAVILSLIELETYGTGICSYTRLSATSVTVLRLPALCSYVASQIAYKQLWAWTLTARLASVWWYEYSTQILIFNCVLAVLLTWCAFPLTCPQLASFCRVRSLVWDIARLCCDYSFAFPESNKLAKGSLQLLLY